MSLRLTAQRWQCFFENAICCQNDNYLKISCVVACFYNNFISYVYKFHTGTLLSLFYMCYGWLAGGWLRRVLRSESNKGDAKTDGYCIYVILINL